jgi:hypothetical protein
MTPIIMDNRWSAYLPRNAPRTNPPKVPSMAPIENVTGPFLITTFGLLLLLGVGILPT